MSPMRKNYRLFVLVVILVFFAPEQPTPTSGPGPGSRWPGSFFAVFAAVFSAFVTLITWPIRLLIADAVRPGERCGRAGSSAW